jgi:hypothetical protein
VGAGTVTRFKVTAGGRTREYRMRVDEPEPGRVLTESDTGSSLVTTTTVSSRDGASLVQISTAWDGAGGIGGVFERMFAPRVMQAIYADGLERLNAYARAASRTISRASVCQHERVFAETHCWHSPVRGMSSKSFDPCCWLIYGAEMGSSGGAG